MENAYSGHICEKCEISVKLHREINWFTMRNKNKQKYLDKKYLWSLATSNSNNKLKWHREITLAFKLPAVSIFKLYIYKAFS